MIYITENNREDRFLELMRYWLMVRPNRQKYDKVKAYRQKLFTNAKSMRLM